MAATAAVFPANSTAQPVAASPQYSYADLADLADAAPVVLDARIRDAIRLEGAQATNLPASKARFYVEADVLALIRGAGGSPAKISYVADVPLDARGRAPKLKKSRVLLLARPVSGQAGSLQLVAPDAQLAWSESTDAQLRAILTELTAPDSPPRITGVGGAFHTAGTLPGEGETQIFLSTQTGDPISVIVLRRPGQAPRWAVALGEIVDEAARPPQPGTLLWYRLACSLPARLPAQNLESLDATQAEIAQADYRLVREGLGRCVRTRAAQPSSAPR
ncbi:hypothetical protein D3876_10735 [Sphingomonas cavernae]|uniref:Uncharacterized protein n=1 Tax=Sphingomonas cavernae TaxID=2320861 RepID=A0A418WND7_9SPHN|nr:hypothetical protein D3876_10735 [Sphingomonas cavernae]